jgi:hypothetical protein
VQIEKSAEEKGVQCDQDQWALVQSSNNQDHLQSEANNLVKQVDAYKGEIDERERYLRKLRKKLKYEKSLRRKAEQTMQDMAQQFEHLDSEYKKAMDEVKDTYEHETRETKRRAAAIVRQERDRTRTIMAELDDELGSKRNSRAPQAPLPLLDERSPQQAQPVEQEQQLLREPPYVNPIEVSSRIPDESGYEKRKQLYDEPPKTSENKHVQTNVLPSQPEDDGQSESGEVIPNGETHVPYSSSKSTNVSSRTHDNRNGPTRTKVEDYFLVNFNGVYTVGGRRKSDHWS